MLRAENCLNFKIRFRSLDMKPRLNLIFILLFSFLSAESQDKPKKPYELHEEAERQYNDGNFRPALELLDACLKANPGYMDAYSLRASVREQLGDLDGALTDYSIYLENYPDHVDVLMSRAALRYQIGFYDLARRDFQRLLLLPGTGETNTLFFRKAMSVNDRNPVLTTTEGHHTSYLYNYLGLTESRLGNFESAKGYLDSAIQLSPSEPDYFVNRGLAKEALGDSTAYLDYERALRLNPTHALALHNLTALKAKESQHLSPEERLSQTIQADSTMLYPYLERAQQRYQSKYYEGALDDYSKALEIDSTDVEIWLGRGLAREKLKDYEGAFSDYTKAIDLKADFAKAWLNRGNVLVKLDRFDDAVEDYDVALIYYPDYALAFYNRAMAKVKLKKENEACSDLIQAEALGMTVEERLKKKICK